MQPPALIRAAPHFCSLTLTVGFRKEWLWGRPDIPLTRGALGKQVSPEVIEEEIRDSKQETFDAQRRGYLARNVSAPPSPPRDRQQGNGGHHRK